MEHSLSLIAMWPLVMLLLLPRVESAPIYDTKWRNATATWYPGRPGEGNPDGGACGYGNLNILAQRRMSTAVSEALWMGGEGCGACYKVKCISNSLCRVKPVTITVTDVCPGGGDPNWCGAGKAHFDMTWEAFGTMAIKGQENVLPNAGYINQLIFKRTPCVYKKKKIAFSFKPESNDWWKSLLIRNVGGPGTVTDVFIKPAGFSDYIRMEHDWGANYVMQSNGPRFLGPFYVKLVNSITMESVECPRPIPEDFQNGKLYNCGVQWPLPSPPPSTSSSTPLMELAPPSSSLINEDEANEDQIIDPLSLSSSLTSSSPPSPSLNSSPSMEPRPPSSSLKNQNEANGDQVTSFSLPSSSSPSPSTPSFSSVKAPSFYPESLTNKKRFRGTTPENFSEDFPENFSNIFDFSDLNEETDGEQIESIG